MRHPLTSRIAAAALSAAALLLSACGQRAASNSAALSDDLKRDLELVTPGRSDGLELASSLMRPRGPQILSAIEATPLSTRAPAPTKRRHPSPHTAPVPTRVAIGGVPVESSASTVESVPHPVAASAPPPVAPRPIPVAVSYPSSTPADGSIGREPGDGGIGTGAVIGTMIGVILRGGAVGHDRCDPRTDRRPGGGISINQPFPPIGRGRISSGPILF